MPTAKYEYIYICWIHNANDMIMCSSKCGRDMSEKNWTLWKALNKISEFSEQYEYYIIFLATAKIV